MNPGYVSCIQFGTKIYSKILDKKKMIDVSQTMSLIYHVYQHFYMNLYDNIEKIDTINVVGNISRQEI